MDLTMSGDNLQGVHRKVTDGESDSDRERVDRGASDSDMERV